MCLILDPFLVSVTMVLKCCLTENKTLLYSTITHDNRMIPYRMIGLRKKNRRSISANSYRRIGTATLEIIGCKSVLLLMI